MSGMNALIIFLLLFGSWAGMWVWTVKQRGEWNLFFANIAGAFAGLMVGSLLLVLYGTAAGLSTVHPNAGRSLPVFLAVVGAGYGTWKLISRGHHSPQKQFLLHLGGGLAGLVAAFCGALLLSPFLHAAQ